MSERLLDVYDALLLDLDGTVYRGEQVVPGAPEAVAQAREQAVAVRFVTNNASRAPQEVADHLAELGFGATLDEVSTSAQAGAAVLAEHVPAGSPVVVVGSDALAEEVRLVGLRPVRTASSDVTAVVQGLSKDTGWRELAEACLAIRAGALWVACNNDTALPTERGLLPGNGALVAALRAATDAEPLVAGKPERPLMDQAVRTANASRPLVVGDRLDTDVLGAHHAGLDALLVLSGVATPAQLLTAAPELRPRYLAADLSAVSESMADLEIAVADSPWTVRVEDGVLLVSAAGAALAGTDGQHPWPAEVLDLLRQLCAAWWATGGGAGVRVCTRDDVARTAVSRLLPAELVATSA